MELSGCVLLGKVFGIGIQNCVYIVDGKREQGWRSGESARFPPVSPGFSSQTRRHMWVEFVVGSLLAPGGFSPVLRFPLSSKTNISKFQFDLECTYTY